MPALSKFGRMDWYIKDLGDLPEAAAALLRYAADQRVFLLHGPMGAGKTTFVKAICRKLGVRDTVASPTFGIVHEYLGTDGPVYHFDFYRLRHSREALDMGYEEYLWSGNYCFVEWPEKADDILPLQAIHVSLSINPDGTRHLKAGKDPSFLEGNNIIT